PTHRDEISLQQVANLERTPGAARSDQAHDAMASLLVPLAAGEQGAKHHLAQLRVGREHAPEPGAVELDHLGRLDGHTRTYRRLAGEGRDVADERSPVGLRDVDVLAGLAVDELDQPVLKRVEGRVAYRVLVENLAGGERAPRTPLGQPAELGLRQPGEQDVVVEVRESLGANYLGGGHRPEAIGIK